MITIIAIVLRTSTTTTNNNNNNNNNNNINYSCPTQGPADPGTARDLLAARIILYMSYTIIYYDMI